MEVRKMLKYDITTLKRIEESASNPSPSWKTDFANCLKIKRFTCLVAEEYGEILGYMIYERDKKIIHLSDIAVHPDKQRIGVGTKLFSLLRDVLKESNYEMVVFFVNEKLTKAHLFLQKMGAKAVKVHRNFYRPGRDAYEFNYMVEKESPIKEKELYLA